MEVTSTRDGSAARVVVAGDIDSETSPELEQAFAVLLRDGAREFIVDLAGVSFLSSAGLSVLIGAHGEADRFRLEAGNRTVDRLIALTGLTMLYGDEETQPA